MVSPRVLYRALGVTPKVTTTKLGCGATERTTVPRFYVPASVTAIQSLHRSEQGGLTVPWPETEPGALYGVAVTTVDEPASGEHSTLESAARPAEVVVIAARVANVTNGAFSAPQTGG